MPGGPVKPLIPLWPWSPLRITLGILISCDFIVCGSTLFCKKCKKWAGNVTFLPFHPGCQFQVPPLAPWTLELLAHPKDTHIHVLLLLGTRYWNKQSHVDTVGGQLNYLLSRGSVLPWEARQTRHSQWSGLTLRTYSWICLWTCKM